MFDLIKHVNIYSPEGQTVLYRPTPVAMIAANNLWKMICWIHNDFLRDCLQTTPERYRGNSEFSIRNTSRTLSYINHVYLLEGILDREYSRTIQALNYYDQVLVEDSNEITKRSTETKDIVDFRNMVAGHTVFSDPRENKGDTPRLEFESIFNINSHITNPNDLSNFAIGGMQVRFGEFADNDGGRDIPQINIKSLHPEVTTHFLAWNSMLIDKVDEFITKTSLKKIGDFSYLL